MLKLAVIAAIFIITIECKYLLAETDSDEDSSQLQNRSGKLKLSTHKCGM